MDHAPSTGRTVASIVSWLLAALVVCGVALRLLGLEQGAVLVPAMALFPYAVILAGLLLAVPWLTRNRLAAVVMTAGVLVGGLLLLPRVIVGSQPAHSRGHAGVPCGVGQRAVLDCGHR